MTLRVGALVSGKGTNLQAILDAAEPGVYEVVLVVSSVPGVPALARAETAGVKAIVVRPSEYPDRETFDRAVGDELEAAGAELVCLAGFMRLLSASFVERFRNRVLNVHPALLPAFPGGRAVADALAWGARVTGATVHFIDEEVDHGPILLQEAVPVLPGDDEARLHDRIRSVEHRLYPEAVRLFAAGRVRVEGRHVTVSGSGGAE